MEFDFVDEMLNVAAVRPSHVDDPVVRETFLCRTTTQNCSVTQLQPHLHRLPFHIPTRPSWCTIPLMKMCGCQKQKHLVAETETL